MWEAEGGGAERGRFGPKSSKRSQRISTVLTHSVRTETPPRSALQPGRSLRCDLSRPQGADPGDSRHKPPLALHRAQSHMTFIHHASTARGSRVPSGPLAIAPSRSQSASEHATGVTFRGRVRV